MIPSQIECLSLLDLHGVPPNIVEHSRMVQRVGLCLCTFLNRGGANLNPAMVDAGSLLHDIAKMRTLNTGESHAREGARVVEELGYSEVADIIRQHVVLDEELWEGPVNEVSLVYYADKRVKHTDIVSLAERFQDLKERYGRSPSAENWLDRLGERCYRLESRMFQRLPITPDMLNSLLDDR